MIHVQGTSSLKEENDLAVELYYVQHTFREMTALRG